ncbi:coiled-coil domain-containing protein 174 isoform X2 [Battus philenor]|uniref:coiled-coil domain-containing protein 174 isoform X2 n=1 Tax=Battus philenor TaxID=42288 RepID=UPI0035D0C148
MNDQSTKKICFNKSILLNLKAEVLKKQEEVIERKQLPQHKVENFKAPKIEKKEDESQQSRKSFKDSFKAVDTDELEACRKSKLALEKKTKLYEHLSDSNGNSELADRFLVDFNGKKKDECERLQDNSVASETIISSDSDDNEWMEFTDCLGRTRKCLKTDLDLYKKRDKELLKVVKDIEEIDESIEDPNDPEKPMWVTKTKDFLKSLRQKWDKDERDLLAKERDIHYQDLLFDEARIHGVGYYSFSTDETKRQQQMEELMKRRQETLRAQQEASEQKKKRDELLSARIAAARARQRARAGLPPEEPKKNEKDFTTCLLEFLTQQRNEADAKAKEDEKKLREEQEKERQKLREAYVREWDIGKEGMDEKVKRFKELTQDEYVEQQRAKRINEFAPLKQSHKKVTNKEFDTKGKTIADTNISATKTWADVIPTPAPQPPVVEPIMEESPKGLFFSTKKNVKYKNFVPASTPIQNEIDDEQNSTTVGQRPENNCGGNSAEIPPPPTYDYYGPVPKQPKNDKPFDSDMKEAYTQGAKSLEPKVSTRKLPKHYDFAFD